MPVTVPLLCYPRSGVTFLRHVLEVIYGVKTLSAYSEPEDETGALFAGNRWWNPDDMPDCGGEVLFLKTHESLAAQYDSPAIHLIRDGRDTLCSHAQYDMRWGPAASMPHVSYAHLLEQLIAGTWPRTLNTNVNSAKIEPVWNWTNHARAVLRRPFPTTTIYFEQLIREPVATVRAAIAALDIELRETGTGGIYSFAELHKRDPAFFPKGKVGRWREDMPQRLQDAFWTYHGEMMAVMGYAKEMVTV